jgi:hypothetical protein
LVGIATLAACTGPDTDSVYRDHRGVVITEHDDALLRGELVTDRGAITFESRLAPDGEASLAFTLNGKLFTYAGLPVTDTRDGWYAIGADHIVTAADSALAATLHASLNEYLGLDTLAMARHEAGLAAMAYFLAHQVDGSYLGHELHKEIMAGGPMSTSLNDDNKLCIKKNTTLAAWYDNRSGVVSSPSVVVGSNWGTSACGSGNYSCMGRCGAGCSGFGGGWTLDCLEHDACSHNLCASGGSGSADCGDEYNHASSDIFSSCSGN